MKRAITYLILLSVIPIIFLAGSLLPAEGPVIDPDRLFKEANQRYAADDYEGAVSDYRMALSTGLRSGNLYYNIGNALVKNGKLGEAILNYERARLLMPRDGDLLSNIRYAKSLMKQKDIASNRHWLLVSIDIAFGYLTFGEMVWGMLLLIYVTILLSIGCVFFKQLRGYMIPAIVIIATIIIAEIPPLYQKAVSLRRDGIVVVPITDARYEPLKRGEVAYPVYEGMKVSILSSRNGWRKIIRPDGKIGWVTGNSVAPIAETVE